MMGDRFDGPPIRAHGVLERVVALLGSRATLDVPSLKWRASGAVTFAEALRRVRRLRKGASDTASLCRILSRPVLSARAFSRATSLQRALSSGGAPERALWSGAAHKNLLESITAGRGKVSIRADARNSFSEAPLHQRAHKRRRPHQRALSAAGTGPKRSTQRHRHRWRSLERNQAAAPLSGAVPRERRLSDAMLLQRRLSQAGVRQRGLSGAELLTRTFSRA